MPRNSTRPPVSSQIHAPRRSRRRGAPAGQVSERAITDSIVTSADHARRWAQAVRRRARATPEMASATRTRAMGSPAPMPLPAPPVSDLTTADTGAAPTLAPLPPLLLPPLPPDPPGADTAARTLVLVCRRLARRRGGAGQLRDAPPVPSGADQCGLRRGRQRRARGRGTAGARVRRVPGDPGGRSATARRRHHFDVLVGRRVARRNRLEGGSGEGSCRAPSAARRRQ